MRLAGVCAPTIPLLLAVGIGLSACGKDPILTRAEEAKKAATKAGGAEAGTPTEPSPGTPGQPQRANIGDPQPGTPKPPAPGDPNAPTPGVPGGPTPGPAGEPTPGVPDAPTPGIPDAPKPGLPGSPQPFSGPTTTVTGTVTYAAYTHGKVRITAFDGDHSVHSNTPPRVVASGEAEGPGAFTLTVPQGTGKLFIEAAIDEDNDGKPGPQDPQGNADRFPVTVGSDPVSGLTISLVSRPSPDKGPKSDY